MFEEFRSFGDYIKIYELQRAEGVLLRHLNSVYKVLAQTVPDAAKTEALREMEEYLRTLLRQVDSSLLDEWERLRHPERQARPEAPEVRPPGAEEAAQDVTRDRKAFLAAVRTRIFRCLRAWVDGEMEMAVAEVGGAADPTMATRMAAQWKAYVEGHGVCRLDSEARNLRHTHVVISDDRKHWRVEQMLVDLEEANDWRATFEVALEASKAAREPVLRWLELAPVGFVSAEPAGDGEVPKSATGSSSGPGLA
jgi:hypothetical protein